MNSKTVPQKTLAVIDQYLHFRCSGKGPAISVPYYNNSHKVVRAGLRGQIGKGSPADICDEAEIALARDKKSPEIMSSGEEFKHFLVDHNVGIDCSGFIYYVLNAEHRRRLRLYFPYAKGIMGKIRSKTRPAESTNVATLAHDKNSRTVNLKDVAPGDIITMVKIPTNESENKNIGKNNGRDHILFIHQVDYENSLPVTIHYSHSIAWPSDGKYDHGVRQGKIDIIDLNKPLTEQKWTEAGKAGDENYTYARAVKTRTEIRRMLSL